MIKYSLEIFYTSLIIFNVNIEFIIVDIEVFISNTP